MFISFISQKGGTGKTTLALHVAAAMAQTGLKTLLIDADPQASAMAWHACRMQHEQPSLNRLTIMAISNGTITSQIPELAKAYDCVVIDGPPRGDRIARDVILASDMVLVPTRLSGFDVWAGDSITKIIEELRPVQEMANKRPLDWYYVINQKNPRTTAGRIILKALERVEGHLLDSHVCERAAFIESTSQGLTIFETEAKGSKGSLEVSRLVDEILERMHKREQRRAA
ncbi:MAG: ParA family protein [Hyphomicrobiaceae bacterium]|nr:ParA family protein [Hyphomicrobiaceae bacterium]